MPKLKTRRSIAKRFRRTASGKFKRPRTNRRHLLTGRDPKRKRQLRKTAYVQPSQERQLERHLPYGS
ncbi:MAG: 50S ribosomal protein L35 [Candidatus Omnitrophica bacterium]|nr:50S ribosomal protein L35 [Candidatus Omnitrophota bacterium]